MGQKLLNEFQYYEFNIAYKYPIHINMNNIYDIFFTKIELFIYHLIYAVASKSSKN